MMFNKSSAFIAVVKESNLHEWTWAKSFKNVITETHKFFQFSYLRFSPIGKHNCKKRRLLKVETESKITLYKLPQVYWSGGGFCSPNVSNYYREVHKLTPTGSQL